MVSSRRREETRFVGRRRDDDAVGGGKHTVSVCVCVWLFRRLLLALSLTGKQMGGENFSLLFSDTLN